MVEHNSLAPNDRKTRLISQVLQTALTFWLRSQVSQVSQIDVEIRASDPQILSGRIPWVSIVASQAVYRGLHITQIQLAAENIQVNIGAILKGQPLRLSQIVPVVGEVMIDQKDFNNSLASELLLSALNDLLVKILPESCPESKPINWQEIILEHSRIILHGRQGSEDEATFLEIGLCLMLLSCQELQLANVQIWCNKEAILDNNQGLLLDLGSDVDIRELTLIPGQLLCRGRISVNP